MKHMTRKQDQVNKASLKNEGEKANEFANNKIVINSL